MQMSCKRQCLKYGCGWTVMDMHPGTYFQGWMPSSHFLGQCSLNGLQTGQLILRKIRKIVGSSPIT